MGQPFVQEKICPVSNTVHISYSDIGYSVKLDIVTVLGWYQIPYPDKIMLCVLFLGIIGYSAKYWL